MRYSLLAISGLIFAVALTPKASLATGNVLLPSSTSSTTSSPPNLGLSPTEPAPAPVSASPVSPAQPASTSATAPNADAKNQPALPPWASTPAPQSSTTPSSPAVMPAAPSKAADVMSSPVSAEAASRLPAGAIATHILHQGDVSSLLAANYKDAEHSLDISLGSKSIYGSRDVQLLKKKLGLESAQIPSACTISINGVVQTDKGAYIFDGGTSPQVTARYNGTISSYLMSAEANCTANNIPIDSGYLVESNGRYRIPLQGINCAAPKRQVSSLIITYDGSGKSVCSYE